MITRCPAVTSSVTDVAELIQRLTVAVHKVCVVRRTPDGFHGIVIIYTLDATPRNRRGDPSLRVCDSHNLEGVGQLIDEES